MAAEFKGTISNGLGLRSGRCLKSKKAPLKAAAAST